MLECSYIRSQIVVRGCINCKHHCWGRTSRMRMDCAQVDIPALQRQFNDNRQQVVEARSRRDTMKGALATVQDNVAVANRCVCAKLHIGA
jgi:hypothetical protein